MFDLPRRGFIGSLIASVAGVFCSKPKTEASCPNALLPKTFELTIYTESSHPSQDCELIRRPYMLSGISTRRIIEQGREDRWQKTYHFQAMAPAPIRVYCGICETTPCVCDRVGEDGGFIVPRKFYPEITQEMRDDASVFPTGWLEEKLRSEIDNV